MYRCMVFSGGPRQMMPDRCTAGIEIILTHAVFVSNPSNGKPGVKEPDYDLSLNITRMSMMIVNMEDSELKP